MGLKIDFVRLNRTANEVSSKLYDMCINYLNNDIEFPYYEVNKLVDKYESFYLRVYKNKNSNINKFLSKMNVFSDELDSKYNAPSKDVLLLQVSEKIFYQVLFDANKYIPTDEESKEYIYNKLLPIIKNLRVVDITDIYSKIKKSAIIRGFVFNDKSNALLQEMFVNFIISVLSYNSYNKFNYIKSEWTPEEVCRSILNEPILSGRSSMRKIK